MARAAHWTSSRCARPEQQETRIRPKSLRVEKNGVYRYDLQYRQVKYHNRLPSLWRGEHGLTVERAMQTHDITFFPGSNFEVLLGYDRNGRSGPGFSSVGTTDNFGVLDARNYLRYQADLRQSNKQYRAGFTAKFVGLALTATHAIDLYEEEGRQADASGFPSATSNIQARRGLHPLSAVSRADIDHDAGPEDQERPGYWIQLPVRLRRRHAKLGSDGQPLGAGISHDDRRLPGGIHRWRRQPGPEFRRDHHRAAADAPLDNHQHHGLSQHPHRWRRVTC